MFIYPSFEHIWFLIAGITAMAMGFFLVMSVRDCAERIARERKVRQSFLGDKGAEYEAHRAVAGGVSGWVLGFMVDQSRAIAVKPEKRSFVGGVWKLGAKSYPVVAKKSGFDTRISFEGFCQARALLALSGSGGGALVGVVFSSELAVVGALIGLCLGWGLPLRSLRHEKEARKNELENHLSEMLEVVSLGLRSGLSFDRSFELYHVHFSTPLGRESAGVQQQWQIGLKTREEALRDLVGTYDSVVFSRVIENVIRSLRFGSSLADSFDSSALEARVLHKARREEEVAKAPVKMLIPTAALILPAMLLLVLGPVMLDMMQGF